MYGYLTTMDNVLDIRETIFSMLQADLKKQISSQKRKKCLRVMLEKQLNCFDENNLIETFPFSRKDIKSLVFGRDLEEKELDNIHRYIQQSDLQNAVDEVIQNKSKYLNLGFLPVINSNYETQPNGGSSRERLFWLDIKPVDDNEIDEEILTQELEKGEIAQKTDTIISDNSDNEFYEQNLVPPNFYTIKYEREDLSNIKLSIFSKIVFEKGELKMKSFTGYIVLLVLILLFFASIALIALIALIIILLPQQKNMTLYSAFIIMLYPFVLYSFWKNTLLPLHRLTINRVIKAPQFLFLALNEDEADMEMYREDGSAITRITRFKSTCPICTAPILLEDGKPDQKAPLVGRCREAPHAHVYSFDRVTLRGYFLGHEGYLKMNTIEN